MKAHRTDAVSLTFGLIFLGVVVWWVAGSAISVNLPDLGWFVAGALILFGIVGLLGMLRGDRSKRSEDPRSPAPPAPKD